MIRQAAVLRLAAICVGPTRRLQASELDVGLRPVRAIDLEHDTGGGDLVGEMLSEAPQPRYFGAGYDLGIPASG